MKRTIHLSIDEQVIKDAKKRCIDEGASLSQLVEGLLLKRLADSRKFVFLEKK